VNEIIRKAAKLYYDDVSDTDLDAIEKSGKFVEKRINELLKHIDELPNKRLASATFAGCISAMFQNFPPKKEKEYLEIYIKRCDIKDKDSVAFSDLVKRLEIEEC